MGHNALSTREKIFWAAIQVFGDKGFKGATVREICQRAGSQNLNVVNYYFGGKAKLYKAILEMMFAELGNRMANLGGADTARETEPGTQPDPEERLCGLIRAYCAMLFSGGEASQAILALYNKEMANPSPYLPGLIDRYLVPQNQEILALMREIMGHDAPHWLLRDCAIGTFSQPIYYSTTWEICRRINPEHPRMDHYHEHLAEHVCRFSLAGIREMRRAYDAGELTPPAPRRDHHDESSDPGNTP